MDVKEKLRQPVSSIMTRDIKFINKNTIMNKVADIFRGSTFHHLPVLDQKGSVVGIISKMDFNVLLHHCTIFNRKDIEQENEKYLSTLIAEDVMTNDPACIHFDSSIESAIQVFIENIFHALPVVDNDICVGILTPHDIMSYFLQDVELLNE